MGLLSYLRGDNIQLGIDGAEDRALTQDQVPVEVWQAWAPRGRPLTTVSRQNAMAVATAWSCVKLLADGIATIPLRVYRQLPDGSRIPAGPDQRLAQLLARPWPGATAIDLVSMMVTHLCLFGEVWMPKFVQEGSIVTLGPLLHPDRCQIFIRGTNVSYALDGREEYGPPDIVFIRGLLDSIGLRGMSPVQQAQSSFELNEALRESSHQFFKEGSRPSGVLTVGEGASQAAIQGLREDWRNLYSAAGGIKNMHRVAVLRGEMKFTPITFSMADQEFLASPRVQRPGDRRDLRTAGMGGQRRLRLEPHLRQHDPASPVPDPALVPADHQPHRSRTQRRPDLVSRQHVLRV